VTFLGANTLLGALSGGALQKIRGGSFRDGFVRGALGGAVAYGGRRVVVKDFRGAGLLGRQVSAVGISIARNAGEGEPSLSRLSFPVGPLTFDWQRGGSGSLGLRIDARSAGWMVAAAFEDRLEMDWGASLSAGTAVFQAPRHRLGTLEDPHHGQAIGSLILLSRDPSRHTLGHERVHVLQQDFGRELWGYPLERWIAGFLPGGEKVTTWVDPGIFYGGLTWSLSELFDVERHNQPWEVEADFLERR
jgi:hypothetical protein